MTLRTQIAPQAQIVPVAGARIKTDLINGVLGKFIDLTIKAQVQISVAAATSIVNRGRLSAMFDEITLVENGEVRHELVGTVCRHVSEANAPSALTSIDLASTAVGIYQLSESMTVFFRWPGSAKPDETAYIERNQKRAFQLRMRLVKNPELALTVPGPATVAVTNITVDVEQDFHIPDQSTVAPYFIPLVSQTVSQIVGATTKQREDVKLSNNIRAVVISQEVVLASGATIEVGDILNNLEFKGDRLTPIGPGKVPVLDLMRKSEKLYGGRMIPSNNSHLFIGFQEDGLLSNTLNLSQDTNWRWILDAQPSATAGTSQLRFTYFELEHTPGITSPVPFPY